MAVYLSTLGEVLGDKKGIVAVEPQKTVEEVLALLAVHKIHSVAVSNGKGGYLGIVNRVDLLTPVAFDPKLGESPDFKAGAALKTPVGDLLGITKESRDLRTYLTVDRLPVLLNDFSQGVHSVLISDAEGKAVAFLSQSDVSNYLWKNKDQLGDWVAGATAQAIPAQRPVKVVRSSDSALMCFRELLIGNIGAGPIVDAEGKVVATLSLSDLTGLDMHNIQLIMKPVLEFLQGIHGKINPTIGCETKDSLLSVHGKLAENGIHQLWLLEDSKPVAAISLSNLIQSYFLRAELGPQYFSQFNIFSSFFSSLNLSVKPEHKDIFNIPLSNLIKPDKPFAITIDQNQTQRKALEEMKKKNLLSLPVTEGGGEGEEGGLCVGVVGVYEILTLLLFNSKLSIEGDAKSLESRLSGLDDPIRLAIGLTSESSTIPRVSTSASLFSILPALCQGHHRVLLSSPASPSKLYILSQSDIISHFVANIAHLGGIVDEKIANLFPLDDVEAGVAPAPADDAKRKISKKNLKKLSSSTKTLTIFREMVIDEVRSIAIVDEKSQDLIACLSSSDVRGLVDSNVVDLALPVVEFLKQKNSGSLPALVTCAKEDTLGSVLKKLVTSHVHRVWVVESGKPIGVVSMTDVIGALYLDKCDRS